MKGSFCSPIGTRLLTGTAIDTRESESFGRPASIGAPAKSAIELVRILCDGLTGTWRSANPCSSWAECDRCWEMPVFGSHQLTGRSHCFALGSGSFSFLYGAHIRLYSSAHSRSNSNDRAFVRGGTTESQSPLRSVCYLAVLSDFRRFRRPGARTCGRGRRISEIGRWLVRIASSRVTGHWSGWPAR